MAEQRRVNPVCQGPHLVHGTLDVVMQLVKELSRPRGISLQGGTREPRLNG